MIRNLLSTFSFFIFFVFLGFGQAQEAQKISSTEQSLRWLKSRIVPNKTVPKPVKGRESLVLSYDMDPADKSYKYVFSRSFIYDVALTIIALDMWDEEEIAGRVADAAARLADVNPSLYFSYNTHNSFPSPNDDEGIHQRSGASGWLGYALCFHIRTLMKKDPASLKNNNQAKKLLASAKKIAEELLKRQVTDSQDVRYGLITGGRDTYILRVDKKLDKVVEEFKRQEITWASVEHNIDMYFFYRDLAYLSKDKKFTQAAKLIAEALQKNCWNELKGMFNQGQSSVGSDEAPALDCASWGGLFCLSQKDEKRSKSCLSSLKGFESEHNKSKGFKAYYDKAIYESYVVGAFYYPKNPRKNWNDIELVWSEGSFGAGLLYHRMGEKEKAKKLIKDMSAMQKKDGGWAYGTREIRHEFSTATSVAGTAWHLILEAAIADKEKDQMFWGVKP